MKRIVPVAVALALLATLLLGAMPIGAAFPGENGKIVFTSNRDGNWEVWVMNADGSNPTQLTFTDEGFAYDPTWSADGARIAYSYETASSAAIYVMDADGSNPTRVTDPQEGDFDYYPAWSPDGNQIVFSRHPEGFPQVYVVNSDGAGLTQLTNSEESACYDPAWSPDGSKIAFASGMVDSPCDIFVMDADGSNPTNFTNSDNAHEESPNWSPDGSKISFCLFGAPVGIGSTSADCRTRRGLSALDSPGNWDIYTINPDGTGRVQLTNTLDVNENSPAWSPDGTKIAYVWSDNESNDIYVMNTTGSGQSNLTNNLGYDNYPDWQPIPVAPTPTPAPTVTPDPPAPPEVPEPGTMMLLASGLAGLGGLTAFRNRFRR